LCINFVVTGLVSLLTPVQPSGVDDRVPESAAR
jgi:hypothetical protein